MVDIIDGKNLVMRIHRMEVNKMTEFDEYIGDYNYTEDCRQWKKKYKNLIVREGVTQIPGSMSNTIKE